MEEHTLSELKEDLELLSNLTIRNTAISSYKNNIRNKSKENEKVDR